MALSILVTGLRPKPTVPERRGRKRRGGRPRLDDSARRSAILTVRSTPADAALICRAAGDRHESISDYLLRAGRTRAGRPVEKLASTRAMEIRRELAPIGSNLNQVARAINTALARGGTADDVARVTATAQTLAALEAAVARILAR